MPLEDITYLPVTLAADDTEEHFELIVSTASEPVNTRGELDQCFLPHKRSVFVPNKATEPNFLRFLIISGKLRPSPKRKADDGVKKTASKYGYLREIHSNHHSKKKQRLVVEQQAVVEHKEETGWFSFAASLATGTIFDRKHLIFDCSIQ